MRGHARRTVAIATGLVLGGGTVWAVLDTIDRPATVDTAAVRVTTPPTPPPTTPSTTVGTSLRFGGAGTDDLDRVKIPLTATSRVNVGATDFTVELWIRGRRADNPSTTCTPGDAGWIEGHIVVDRDVYGAGDRGDFGMSLAAGRVAWGVSSGATGATLCGITDVLDGNWHHVAVTRAAASGALAIWVDGRLDASVPASPATGDVSYRVGRATAWPGSDPFLVLGAEKHDAGPAYPSFDGSIDDLRISTVVRYTARFTPPSQPHTVDADTAALYRFDEPSGQAVVDAAGTSDGVLRVGPTGPRRERATPFG